MVPSIALRALVLAFLSGLLLVSCEGVLVTSSTRIMTYFLTSCPTDWTDRNTDPYRGRVIKGTPANTGVGSTKNSAQTTLSNPTHNHNAGWQMKTNTTVTARVECSGSTDQAIKQATDYFITSSTSGTSMSTADGAIPSVMMNLCEYTGSTQISLPLNIVTFMGPTVTTCPSGFAAFSAAEGRFLVFGAAGVDLSTSKVSPATAVTGTLGDIGTHYHSIPSFSFDTTNNRCTSASCPTIGTTGQYGARGSQTMTWTQYADMNATSLNIPYVQLIACIVTDSTTNSNLPDSNAVFYYDGNSCPSQYREATARSDGTYSNIVGRIIWNKYDNVGTPGQTWGGSQLTYAVGTNTGTTEAGHAGHSHALSTISYSFTPRFQVGCTWFLCKDATGGINTVGSGCNGTTGFANYEFYNFSFATSSSYTTSSGTGLLPFRVMRACSPQSSSTTSSPTSPTTLNPTTLAPTLNPTNIPVTTPSPTNAPITTTNAPVTTPSPTNAPIAGNTLSPTNALTTPSPTNAPPTTPSPTNAPVTTLSPTNPPTLPPTTLAPASTLRPTSSPIVTSPAPTIAPSTTAPATDPTSSAPTSSPIKSTPPVNVCTSADATKFGTYSNWFSTQAASCAIECQVSIFTSSSVADICIQNCQAFVTYTGPCITCYQNFLECQATNCQSCFADSATYLAQSCRTCSINNCRPALATCTGYNTAVMQSSTASPTSTTAAAGSEAMNLAPIIGGVLGGCAVVLAGAFFVQRRRRSQNQNNELKREWEDRLFKKDSKEGRPFEMSMVASTRAGNSGTHTSDLDAHPNFFNPQFDPPPGLPSPTVSERLESPGASLHVDSGRVEEHGFKRSVNGDGLEYHADSQVPLRTLFAFRGDPSADELNVEAGVPLMGLNRNLEWWVAFDERTQKIGIIPAAYVVEISGK